MTQPIFFLLAGPNGAGKSSLYLAAVADGLLPGDAEFVNADLYEATHLQHVANPAYRSEQARTWADARRSVLLEGGRSFVSETVFSHPSKLALIEEAQKMGFAVVLLVVCLDDPQRLIARVQQRVLEGGHAVPEERILGRYPRTLENLTKAVRLADMAILYDTGEIDAQHLALPTRVAVCRAAVTKRLHEVMPVWAETVLGAEL